MQRHRPLVRQSHFNDHSIVSYEINPYYFFASAIALSSFAGVHEGEGYYRVQNFLTERYIYVTDNRGSLNMQATTAELGAIEIWKGYEKTISDPATVIYVKDLDGKGRDFDLQDAGHWSENHHRLPVSIIENASTKPLTHRIFGRNSGLTRYIGDGTARRPSSRTSAATPALSSSPMTKPTFGFSIKSQLTAASISA